MLWMMALLVGAALPASCDKRPPAGDVTKVGVSAERAVTIGDDFESALTDWQVVAGDWRQRTADGRIVRDAAELAPGEQITTRFAAGGAISRVERIDE